MIALVSGATRTMARYQHTGHFGQLIVPGSGNIPDPSLPWAADNGAFAGFDEAKFVKMLDRLQQYEGCLFVTCPDVVGDAKATARLFSVWRESIVSRGFPVALVAQDGIAEVGVPWDKIDALFIGGSTEFKLGGVVRALIAEAKKRGKWVHVGRVNTQRRIRYVFNLGADSFDGTGMSRWPDYHFPKYVAMAETPQLALEMDL